MAEAVVAGKAGDGEAASALLVVGLQQRLLSSTEAFARSLKVHRATVERQWDKAAPAFEPGPSGGHGGRPDEKP